MISRHVFNVLVALPFLIALKYLVDLVPQTKQGFFCDDEEIRFPFKENTVQTNQMLVVFALIAIVLMTASEYSLVRHLSKKGKRIVRERKKIHPAILTILFFLICLACAALCVDATVGFSKRTVSRLRPNFINVCKPDLQKLCTGRPYEFIEDYICHGEYNEDEYFSFPSGHSAHAVNFGVFMIFYLQKRYKLMDPSRHFIQLALFGTTVFVCLSRVRDYKHRFSDVLGGASVGLMFSWFFAMHVLKNFRHRYETTEHLMLENRQRSYSEIA